MSEYNVTPSRVFIGMLFCAITAKLCCATQCGADRTTAHIMRIACKILRSIKTASLRDIEVTYRPEPKIRVLSRKYVCGVELIDARTAPSGPKADEYDMLRPVFHEALSGRGPSPFPVGLAVLRSVGAIPCGTRFFPATSSSSRRHRCVSRAPRGLPATRQPHCEHPGCSPSPCDSCYPSGLGSAACVPCRK